MSYQVRSLTNPLKFYTVDTVLNTCTCKGWKFQKKPNHLRKCKHMISRHTSEEMTFIMGPKLACALLSNQVPKTLDVTSYMVSVKYDGVFGRIHENKLILRGGWTYVLHTSFFTPLDVEICIKPAETHTYTHNDVMIILNTLPLDLTCLELKVFDCTCEEIFEKRANKIMSMDLSSIPITTTPVKHFPLPNENWQSIRDKLLSIAINTKIEGFVLRKKDSYYSTTSRVMNGFKIKPIIRRDENF